MTDITERLEAEGIMFAEEGFPEAAALLLDARDEIVRLRIALQQISDTDANFGPDGTRESWKHWRDIAREAMAASGGEKADG